MVGKKRKRQRNPQKSFIIFNNDILLLINFIIYNIYNILISILINLSAVDFKEN